MRTLLVLLVLAVAAPASAATYCWLPWQQNCCPCFGYADLQAEENGWQVCKEYLPSFYGPRIEILSGQWLNVRAVTSDYAGDDRAPFCEYDGFNARGAHVVRFGDNLTPEEYAACVEIQRTWMDGEGMQCVIHQ